MQPDKKLPLVEMFGPTIQGEGAVIGQQTYFFRFGLCDYRCGMCDSMHAVDPNLVKQNAQWLTQEQIGDKFLKEHYIPGSTRWISLSGGNPCIHDLSVLVGALKRAGFRFAVETQGTKAPSWLQLCDIITVSPKGPGMKEKFNVEEMDAFWQYAISANPSALNLKVVCFDMRDLEFAKMIAERYCTNHGYDIPFYLSLGNSYPPNINAKPDLYSLDRDPGINHGHHMQELIRSYKQLWEDIQKDPILSQMRFLPQWHVFVWGNEKGK